MTLARQIAQAEADYDRALRHPRGDGLPEAGARLQHLYAQSRTQQPPATRPDPHAPRCQVVLSNEEIDLLLAILRTAPVHPIVPTNRIELLALKLTETRSYSKQVFGNSSTSTLQPAR